MKPFAWSWSRLKNYRTCPKRHYHVDLAKDFKEAESDELKWGNRFHKEMSTSIDRDKPLPKELEHHSYWPELFRKAKRDGALVNTELQLSMSRDFQPTAWFAPETWFRGIVDVLGIAEHVKKALAIDWKTGGKIQPEFEQLALNAQLIFVHHPEIEVVNTAYHWTAFPKVEPDPKTYTRADMAPLWNKLLPEVAAMEEAQRTTTYPPTPSGICVGWCPVTSCPYHGKGTR